MYNKEALRKELKCAFSAGFEYRAHLFTAPARPDSDTYVDSCLARLAALNEVNEDHTVSNAIGAFDESLRVAQAAFPETDFNKKDLVDDGQEGKGLWEILSFRGDGTGLMHHKRPDGLFGNNKLTKEHLLSRVGKNACIWSVKRLPDNEVFTVGDDVTASNSGNYKITSFLIKPDDMMADLGGNGCVFLKYLRKRIALPVADGDK